MQGEEGDQALRTGSDRNHALPEAQLETIQKTELEAENRRGHWYTSPPPVTYDL